jgi:hypothetical protein
MAPSLARRAGEPCRAAPKAKLLGTVEAVDARRRNIRNRSEVLARIAKARAAAGRIDEAKQVAQHIVEESERADVLASIASAQVKAGLMADAMATFTEALQIAQSLSRKSQVTWSLMSIAAKLPD